MISMYIYILSILYVHKYDATPGMTHGNIWATDT